MHSKPTLFEALGDKLKLLEQINPEKAEGNCQNAAIEAAKVLLKDDYKPTSITASDKALTDPIEKIFGREKDDSPVPMEVCKNFKNLEKSIKKLENGELLIVNGESEGGDHAYILLKKEGFCWLIDADRNEFKMVKDEKDFIVEISPWKEEKKSTSEPKAKFDYIRICFLNGVLSISPKNVTNSLKSVSNSKT